MEDRAAGNRRFALGTAAGVLVGVLLTIGALGLVQPRGAATATPGPTKPAVTTPVTQTATPATQSPSEATTPATPSAPADSRLASPEQGTWFAVIHWMSKSSTSVDKALEYAESRSNNRQIVVLDTDQYKLRGGQSGQWAVGVQGLASMNEASAACRAMGLTPGSQCGRFQVS